VTQGRGWVASIIQYWATITLGPVVLLLVLGLTTGPYFAKTKRILGLSLLTGRDIQKPRVLMGKLLGQETNQHAVAAVIYHRLLNDETFRGAVERFTADPADWKSLRKSLAESINTALEGQQFYDPTNFAGVDLSPETQRLLAKNPKGHDLDLLNRRLLDDAFPEEIQAKSWEWVGSVGFFLLPFVVLSLAFGGFYQLMPNTRVQPAAALVGGIVGGSLWLLNNKLSVLYVSKVASYGQIYGSLGLVPLFLIGMYFSWLILLFGAQVAYAYQNRQSYLQEKQAEGVNQSGREFVALRVMTLIAQHFQNGAKPPGVNELASTLGVPTRLVGQVLPPLLHTKLLVEVLDREIRYAPARPLEQITAHDILHALRSGQGMELDTREDAHRAQLRRQFSSINAAEREASSAMTLAMLANGAGGVAKPKTAQ
jgi:DNA-binding IscR family transcriptional regulator